MTSCCSYELSPGDSIRQYFQPPVSVLIGSSLALAPEKTEVVAYKELLRKSEACSKLYCKLDYIFTYKKRTVFTSDVCRTPLDTQYVHPFSSTSPIQGSWGAGAYTGCRRERGRIHPG